MLIDFGCCQKACLLPEAFQCVSQLSLRGSQAGWAATVQVKWSHQHLGKPQTAVTASVGFTTVAGAR